MAGVGHRKNITAMSATTVTALTTLTGHIPAEADPITETTIIPVTTITLFNDHHEKGRHPKHKKDNKGKKHKKHHDDDRSSAKKLPGGIQKASTMPSSTIVRWEGLFIWRCPDSLI